MTITSFFASCIAALSPPNAFNILWMPCWSFLLRQDAFTIIFAIVHNSFSIWCISIILINERARCLYLSYQYYLVDLLLFCGQYSIHRCSSGLLAALFSSSFLPVQSRHSGIPVVPPGPQQTQSPGCSSIASSPALPVQYLRQFETGLRKLWWW